VPARLKSSGPEYQEPVFLLISIILFFLIANRILTKDEMCPGKNGRF
jgi:hypothetical protein